MNKCIKRLVESLFDDDFDDIVNHNDEVTTITKEIIKPYCESYLSKQRGGEHVYSETDDELIVVNKPIEKPPVNDLIPEDEEQNKEAMGKGLFRRDTRETLKALLNRIIKLESLVSVQAEEIKQLKNGIKSINKALLKTKQSSKAIRMKMKAVKLL